MTTPFDKRNRLYAEEREKLKRSGDPYAPLDGEVFDQEQMEDVTPPPTPPSHRGQVRVSYGAHEGWIDADGATVCPSCGELKEQGEFRGTSTGRAGYGCAKHGSPRLQPKGPPVIGGYVKPMQLPEGSQLGGMR